MPLSTAPAAAAAPLADTLARSGLVAFALVDAGRIVAASPALNELLEVTTPYDAVVGRELSALVAPEDRVAAEAVCEGLAREGAHAQHRCHVRRADGTPIPVLLQGAGVAGDNGLQWLIVFTDLGPWLGEGPGAADARLFEAYDPLTGCATNALLFDRARIALAAARRYRRRAAVLRIHLERLEGLLSAATPTHGAQIQRNLADMLRASARDCDTVARLGHQDYVVLLPEVRTRDDAGVMAARLVESVGRLFDAGEAPKATAAIGVAMYPADGTDFERLLRVAGEALDDARGSIGGRFAFASATSVELRRIEPLALPPMADEEHELLVRRTNHLIEHLLAGAGPGALEQGLRDLSLLLRTHLTGESRARAAASPYEGAQEQLQADLRVLDEIHCILLDVNTQSVTLAIHHLRDWLGAHLDHACVRQEALAS